MSVSDPDRGLASPTIAQLYLEQGHPGRARAICREVLAHDPTNGYALALDERLRRSAIVRIEASFVSSAEAGVELGLGLGELELSWSVPRVVLDEHDDARVDVVLAIASSHEPIRALRYTSIRCLDLDGTRRVDVPLGPASAAIALVLSPGPRRRSLGSVGRQRPNLRVLAVAEPLAW